MQTTKKTGNFLLITHPIKNNEYLPASKVEHWEARTPMYAAFRGTSREMGRRLPKF